MIQYIYIYGLFFSCCDLFIYFFFNFILRFNVLFCRLQISIATCHRYFLQSNIVVQRGRGGRSVSLSVTAQPPETPQPLSGDGGVDADWDLCCDGCSQLQPWLRWNMLPDPDCFSVIWAGGRGCQKVHEPCDFPFQVNEPHADRAQPLVLTSRLPGLASLLYGPVMDLLWVFSVSMLTACVAIPMDAVAGSHSLFTCEPITLRMCQGLSYNSTFMPNIMNHYDQQTAALAMEVQYTADMWCRNDVRSQSPLQLLDFQRWFW